MNRPVAFTASLVVGLFLALGPAAPATAHTDLIGVDPADGSTVGGGIVVTLTFSEAVLTIGAEATITDGLGTASSLEPTFPTPSSVQVTLPELAPGAATLAWRVVAGDGHPIEGTLAYVSDAETIAPPSASPSADAPSPSVTASATPAAPSPSPLIAPAPAEDDSSSFPGPALWIAVFAAVLASSAALLAAKRRR